jgi:hypothetical protein
MRYERPVNARPLSKDQRLVLLQDYMAHYEIEATREQRALKQLLPHDAFAPLLDLVGELLLRESSRLAIAAGPVHDFLEDTPVPACMSDLLPPDFRVFCLALNALKQWVSGEQSATDEYLLGRKARELCRSAVSKCIVTGDPLGTDVQLHHPVRDGRPPLPLSKLGHQTIEGQISARCGDPVEASLIALRRKSNASWAMLGRGWLDLLGKATLSAAPSSDSRARTFARKAAKVSNLSYGQLLSWLGQKGYYRSPALKDRPSHHTTR